MTDQKLSDEQVAEWLKQATSGWSVPWRAKAVEYLATDLQAARRERDDLRKLLKGSAAIDRSMNEVQATLNKATDRLMADLEADNATLKAGLRELRADMNCWTHSSFESMKARIDALLAGK